MDFCRWLEPCTGLRSVELESHHTKNEKRIRNGGLESIARRLEGSKIKEAQRNTAREENETKQNGGFDFSCCASIYLSVYVRAAVIINLSRDTTAENSIGASVSAVSLLLARRRRREPLPK